MHFDEFLALDATTITQQVQQRFGENFGVGIPFNGTRRWYLDAFKKSPEALYELDYPYQVRQQMLTIIGQMFDDGVQAVYTPVIGQALAERGPEYMEFAVMSVQFLVDDEALAWYQASHIHASCYGRLDLLPAEVQARIRHVDDSTRTPQATHHIRYGVFADQPLSHICHQVIDLHHATHTIPSEQDLIEHYYGKPRVDVQMWIGSDQPTVFDVPLVIHEATALYFLQFPTLYLDKTLWRRLLYDVLVVRGDDEALYPDNITAERYITGLGRRQGDHWVPSVD